MTEYLSVLELHTTFNVRIWYPYYVPISVDAWSKAWGLLPLDCLDCGFESRRGHRCLYLLSIVCSQVEVSATGRAHMQRSHKDCGVSN